MATIFTGDFPGSSRSAFLRAARGLPLAALCLTALTFVLHGSALSGWWRWDDPEHLIYSLQYSPRDYFFTPETWRLISPVNFTPLLSLSLDIDVSLFGIAPFGFYLHQLLSLSAAATMTCLLAGLWLPRRWSLAAAALFLLGMPTFVVAQQVMSRHYVEGLVFACAALYCFVFALRSGRRGYAWAGGICYLLAMLCKEIYAPVIVLLLFMPESDLRQRCRHGLPFLFAAIIYIGWRFFMIEAPVSGYSSWQAFDPVACLRQLATLPRLLFGQGWAAFVGLATMAVLIVAAAMRCRRQTLFIALALVLLLLPLLPLTTRPGLARPESFQLARFLFLPWWSVAIFAAWALSVLSKRGGTARLGAGILLAALLWSSASYSWMARASIRQESHWQEVHGRFVWNADASQALLLPPGISLWYCELLSELRRLTGGMPPLIVLDEIQLAELDLAAVAVSSYEPACQCIADISREMPERLRIWRSERVERPLEIDGRSSYRNFSWRFGPYADGQYSVISNVLGKATVPAEGVFEAVIDVDPGVVIVRYDSPEGWITYSEPFRITSQGIRWLPGHATLPQR